MSTSTSGKCGLLGEIRYTGNIADFVESLRQRGVSLWIDNDQLRYRAVKGALTDPDLDEIRKRKDQLLLYLQAATGSALAELTFPSRTPPFEAPLTFSQTSRWNVCELRKSSSIRQVASAMRVRGEIDVDSIRKCAETLVLRHWSLRTRIHALGGAPVQKILVNSSFDMRLHDLTAMRPEDVDAAARELIRSYIREPIDIARDPLFGICVFVTARDQAIVLIAMDHMIADGFSLSIAWREISLLYSGFIRGRTTHILPVPVQFANFADWQIASQGSWLDAHQRHWNRILESDSRIRFPVDGFAADVVTSGWSSVSVTIGIEVRTKLLVWSRKNRTTPAMAAFTAFVAFSMRCCEVSQCVLRYQSNGRTDPSLADAIGFFASFLHLRTSLHRNDKFADLLGRLSVEYCIAHQHADASYFETLVSRPHFTRNPAFNWIPEGSVITSAHRTPDGCASFSPFQFAHPGAAVSDSDFEPAILLFDCADKVIGDLYYPLNRISPRSAERLSKTFLGFLTAMVCKDDVLIENVQLAI